LTRPSIDLNCDMGESFGRYSLGDDAAMLDIVTAANIACGLHAGDPLVMRHTVEMAIARGVAVGAHPGYPDLQGFGRRPLSMNEEELEATILYQLGALAGFVAAAGDRLTHMKPHGALYNSAARDPEVAGAIARAVVSFDPQLIVVTLPGSALAEAAGSEGLSVATEGFADRTYQANGTLVPRSHPGAIIHDPAQAAAHAVRMVTEGAVETITGETIDLKISTLCVHGDTPNAPAIAQSLRQALEAAGVSVIRLATP
jgi:5-oxoprolinase (ATP-hydrolysing) subunit A